jgi:V8-like Glu-specific endopeptidase
VQYDSAQEIPLVLDVFQPYVKMGPGDSGSSLLNEESEIIGLTQGGRNRFYERRQEVLNSFSFQRRLFSVLERINYLGLLK